MHRSRLLYGFAIIIVIIVGLGTRSEIASFLPNMIVKYAGDTLWALMLYFVIGFIYSTKSILQIALITVTIAFAVEFSQLYQGEFINSIRANRIGALFLGRGFVLSDLACYCVGAFMGIMFEFSKLKMEKQKG